ncbi:MAG: saccharopine dehydrogenase [Calditrichaeota bacterium]|nr:MAG: saccharopine dehydrogenase [Calditrichota bacterium]
MKQILILGAGFSTPALIHYLLDKAEENDWFVTVGDIEVEKAERIVNHHPRGAAIVFDVNDVNMRTTHIKKADVVVNMLSPVYQYLIALDCLHHGKHMISASYEDIRVQHLNLDAHRKGILILNEMGLDPGLDHMSAMALIDDVHQREGVIKSFLSYGGGLPAPEINSNPLRYCITWNPRNVVRAGEAGAQYMEEGQIKLLPYHQVFKRTWPVEIEGIGTLEAYPNRNSLIYRHRFGLNGVNTLIRGTLRYPGWSETWYHIVNLGLTNDSLPIPDLHRRTYREFMQMFLPLSISGKKPETRLANYLGISPTGKIMENLRYLGLFSDEVIGGNVKTAADVMMKIVLDKLQFPPGGRDMVIICHEIQVEYPRENYRSECLRTTFTEYGDPDGFTAIAKTVGLPTAIATALLLRGELPLTGCHIPTIPAIYVPVLRELKKLGFAFKEEIIIPEEET